jgi:hypothetical protein
LSGFIINHNDAWEVPRHVPKTLVNVLGMNIAKKQKHLPKVSKQQTIICCYDEIVDFILV